MDTDDRLEREALLAELLGMQEDLETSLAPEIIESVLALRLTMQQLKVLTLLVTEPEGSTIQGLARTAGVSLATMSGIVVRLESQNMVERTIDPRDHRVRRVTATATGRETVRRLLVGRPELSRTPPQPARSGRSSSAHPGHPGAVAFSKRQPLRHCSSPDRQTFPRTAVESLPK